MINSYRQPDEPFDVRDNRAMVSLGPLSSKKYCTYSCPFCYVHAGFAPYARSNNADIIAYLRAKQGEYDIIYVSGDTDSFAPPRAETGIQLLDACVDLGVDLLFTTRAILSDSQNVKLRSIGDRLREAKKNLFACVSIAQLNHPHLEPPPIPSSHLRIRQLRQFRDLGLVSVLAMRPLLPIVSTGDYLRLLELSSGSVDMVLVEGWFSDQGGVMDKGVFQENSPDYHFTVAEMDFDNNGVAWKLYRPTEKMLAIEEYCHSRAIPIFFRSRPAILYWRNLQND